MPLIRPSATFSRGRRKSDFCSGRRINPLAAEAQNSFSPREKVAEGRMRGDKARDEASATHGFGPIAFDLCLRKHGQTQVVSYTVGGCGMGPRTLPRRLQSRALARWSIPHRHYKRKDSRGTTRCHRPRKLFENESPNQIQNPLTSRLPFSLPAGIAILVGYAPLVALHLWGLWRREQYQYFPVCHRRLRLPADHALPAWCDRAVHREPSQVVTASYVVAWVLLAAATLIQSPWMAAVSLNILLVGVLISLGQTRQITNLFGIWLLLWLLVPLPFDVDTRVVVRLQSLSSRISSGILDMWGVRHLMSGNVLQLPDKQFFVDEACSGIISVMSVIACGLIWVVWRNRSLLHVVLLILAGVGWAISLNVARICIITFAHAWWDVDFRRMAARDAGADAVLLDVRRVDQHRQDPGIPAAAHRAAGRADGPSTDRIRSFAFGTAMTRLGDPEARSEAGRQPCPGRRRPRVETQSTRVAIPWCWVALPCWVVISAVSHRDRDSRRFSGGRACPADRTRLLARTDRDPGPDGFRVAPSAGSA